jgi:hypothetical protein
VQSTGDEAQIRHGVLEVSHSAVDVLDGVPARRRRDLRLPDAPVTLAHRHQFLGQFDDPSLGAFTKTCLQAAALFVGGHHEASPGRVDRVELLTDLGGERVVRRRQTSGCGHRLGDRRLIEHRRVVYQHREGLRLPLDERCRARVVRPGEFQHRSLFVPIGAVGGDVAHLERRIAEHVGERSTQGRRPRLAELHDEVGDRHGAR